MSGDGSVADCTALNDGWFAFPLTPSGGDPTVILRRVDPVERLRESKPDFADGPRFGRRGASSSVTRDTSPRAGQWLHDRRFHLLAAQWPQHEQREADDEEMMNVAAPKTRCHAGRRLDHICQGHKKCRAPLRCTQAEVDGRELRSKGGSQPFGPYAL